MSELKCGKCGKPFKYPNRLATHEAKCEGAKSAPAKRAPAKRAPAQPRNNAGELLNVFSIRPEVTVGQLVQLYPAAGIESAIVAAIVAGAS